MSADETILTHVILGDGVAGMSAAEAIHHDRPLDTIVVVSDDPQRYYFRASLTNYLRGGLEDHELWALPPRGWEDLGVTFRSGQVTDVDFAKKVVRLRAGPEIAYDRLLLATGCRARTLATPAEDPKHGIPGADLDGVTPMRTLRDTQRLLERLADTRTKHAVVVGGGILGLEIAQGLVARHVGVTLLHRGPWLLERVVDHRAGELIRLRMSRAGVDVRLGTSIRTIQGSASGGVKGVALDDGTAVACGLVAVAVGNLPNTEFLGTKVPLRGGYVPVDPTMAVACEPRLDGVFAAGDVAVVEDPKQRWKNPPGLWQPARKQGFVAGRAMAGDRGAAYRPGVLYNATRAWDLDLVTIGAHVGEAAPGALIVESPPGARSGDRPVHKRAVVRDGRLLGVLLLGDRREGRALHRLMNLRGRAGDVSAVQGKLFDPDWDVFRWVAEQERQPGVVRDDVPVFGAVGADPEAVAQRRAQGPAAPPAPGTAPTGSMPTGVGRARPLTLSLGKGEKKTFERGTVRIGATLGCDIVVADPSLRDEEIVVACEGAAWLASAGGGGSRPRATLNGRALVETVSLSDHDVLALGKWQALVLLPPLGPVAPPAPAGRPAFLLGDVRHALGGALVRVGRDPDNDVVLNVASVSRFHAQLERDARSGTWYLKDFGSARGTSVNGEPLKVARALRSGDVLAFGPETTLRFEEGLAPAEDPRAETAVARPTGGPRVYLVGIEGPLARRALAIPVPGTVGRGSAADVRVDDPLLSRLHARFEATGDAYAITDPGSANGIVVKHVRIPVGLAVRLADGDEVGLGKTRWRFQTRAPRERVVVADEAPAALPTQGTTLLYRADGPRLVVGGAGRASEHPLLGSPIRVGSAPDNDVVIPLADVSAHHAALFVRGTTYALDDLGSHHGTRVAQLPVDPGDAVDLADGAEVAFGPVTATFHLGSGPVAAGSGGGAPAAPPGFVLAVRARDKHGERIAPIPLEGPGPWVLGRRKPEASVVIPLETVSKRHAELRRVGDGLVLEDLDSANGTWRGERKDAESWVPGEKVTRGRPAPVAVGDYFFLHEVPIRLDRAATPAASGNASPPRRPAAAPVPLGVRLAGSGTALDEDLERVVHEEVDACIGCHDCMEACPLPDHRAVTIGGLNAYAQGIGPPSEVVERFVADCTQCHACVPVCPADLQRSRIVLFNKMKEERRVDPRKRLPLQTGDVSGVSEMSVADLARRLVDHPLVVPLAADERLAFLSRARVRRLARGERLIGEGAFPDAMWLVLEGKVEVGMATAAVEFQRMVVHGPGDTVGEVAVLSDQPSDLGARAETAATVVGFAKYLLLHHAGRSPAFRAALEGLYVARATTLAPARWPELAGLAEATLADLRAAVTLQRFAPEEPVLAAKRQALEFVLVQRGFVREVRRDPEAAVQRARTTTTRPVAPPVDGDPELIFANYVQAGEAFGGGDSGRRGTAVRFVASTTAEVLRIDVDDLRAVEARHPGSRLVERFRRITRRREELAARRDATPSRRGAAPAAPAAGAAQAEAQGLLQGNRLLLIDTRLCVDCDNCVSACARRHGASRLDRAGSGTQVGPFQVPASCYHCDDPLCLYCAEEAIVRLPGGEIQVQTDRCIGCGACAERCPYGNIEMVAKDPPKTSLWKRVVPDPILRWLRLLDDAADDEAARVAVKCDLCAGFDDGPACVRACPVGAAFRTDPRTLFLRTAGGVP